MKFDGALLALLAACFLVMSMPVNATDECPMCPTLELTQENTSTLVGNITFNAQLIAAPASFGTKRINGTLIVARDGSYAYDISDNSPGKYGIIIKGDDLVYKYVDESTQAVNQPEGMAAIADLMYFKDGAPSLDAVAKAEMWAFETGTKQVPTNVQNTTVGSNPSYPAMRESVSNTPFIGGPGYLFQIQVNEKAIFCLATNFVNAAEMGRTIKFGGF